MGIEFDSLAASSWTPFNSAFLIKRFLICWNSLISFLVSCKTLSHIILIEYFIFLVYTENENSSYNLKLAYSILNNFHLPLKNIVLLLLKI